MPEPQDVQEEEIEEIPGESFYGFGEEGSLDLDIECGKVLLCDVKETTWNDRFCGWYDASLTKKGRTQTQEYAQRIKKSGLIFQYGFTSALSRTIETLNIIKNEIGQTALDVQSHWLLNARHVGALTGLNIEETIAHYSPEQVDYWTNYFISTPPKMNIHHKYYLSIVNNFPNLDEIKMTESYQDTQYRVIKYWEDVIVPKLQDKETETYNTNIILVCHDSVLLSITKYLERQNPSSIVNINIKPPFYYTVNDHGKPLNKIPL